MAENGQEDRSSEDLTEQESLVRKEEFRQKGQVAQSKEVTGLLALFASAATLYVMSPSIGQTMLEFMREIFSVEQWVKYDLGSATVVGQLLTKTLKIAGAIVLPIAAASFVMGALGSFGQIGAIFSFDPLTPSASKINPLSGIQRLFSKKHIMESCILLIKLTAVLVASYFIIRDEVFQAPSYALNDPAQIMGLITQASKAIFVPILGIILVFAIFDFWINKHDYSMKLRMTKEEAKREHREREGDPHIKARIRAIQRETSRRRMMAAVRKADVIVTNPTHIAIALVYDKESMSAPRVVAKGADFVAQKIKKIAADAGVPLVENVPLARTLFKTVKINQVIPRSLYQAVAEVLAYVYKLKNRGV